MEDKNIPVLNYAPAQPRSMQKRVLLGALAVSAAGAAIVVGAHLYNAGKAQQARLMGSPPPTQLQWQPATSGGTSGESQETLNESPGDPGDSRPS